MIGFLNQVGNYKPLTSASVYAIMNRSNYLESKDKGIIVFCVIWKDWSSFHIRKTCQGSVRDTARDSNTPRISKKCCSLNQLSGLLAGYTICSKEFAGKTHDEESASQTIIRAIKPTVTELLFVKTEHLRPGRRGCTPFYKVQQFQKNCGILYWLAHGLG